MSLPTPVIEAASRIVGLGHEIGLHTDATTVALVTGRDPGDVVMEKLAELRDAGFEVRGAAAHGNQLRHTVRYHNREAFSDCRRMPDEDGRVAELPSRPLADYGLVYESYELPHALYLCDSAGRWGYNGAGATLEEAADGFPHEGQVHALLHPEWWELGGPPSERRRFGAGDLADLEAFLDRATAVVPMLDVALGATGADVVGMRHDIDSDLGNAVRFAEWEHARGVRATYFLLHTSEYWNDGPPLNTTFWQREAVSA